MPTTIQRRQAAGLCPACGRCPPTPGAYYCQPCADARKDKNRDKQRLRIAKRREEGVCLTCAAPRDGDSVYCARCAATRNKRAAAAARVKMAESKAAGLCITCHKTPAEPGVTRCAACADARAPGERMRAMRVRRERIAAGLCTHCGVTPVQGYRECVDCATGNAEWRAKHTKEFRAAAAAAGLCQECRAPAISETVRCLRCTVKLRLSSLIGRRANEHLVAAVLSTLERQSWRCAYTGVQLTFGEHGNASIEHISPKATHPERVADPMNLVWVDLKVNTMKRAMSAEEFTSMVKLLANCTDKITAVAEAAKVDTTDPNTNVQPSST